MRVSKAMDKIQNGITQRKGEILEIHDQGRRRLAFQIDGHREGYYYIVYFNLNLHRSPNFGKSII